MLLIFSTILVKSEKCEIYHLLYGSIHHISKIGKNKSLVESFFSKEYLLWIENVKNIMYSMAISVKL